MSLYLTTFIIIINVMFNKAVLETSGFAFRQDSLKAEEKALKTQLSCFKEEFQLLVRSAAELYPEILDDEFPQKVAARQQLQLSPNKSPSSPEADITRRPRYSRGSYRSNDAQHRKPMFELKRYPRRSTRLTSEEAVAQIQEQFENNASASAGIDARKIRSSLPNSPTDEMLPEPSQENSLDDERTRRLKKKMIESRTVDVVNLGLF